MTRLTRSRRSTLNDGGLSVDGFLAQLARRLRIPDADVVTADEVRGWPDGKVQELLREGILEQIEPGTTVVCDQCDEHCSIEPQRRTDPRNGRAVGFHICMREEAGGRIEIDLDRLRRWRINESKLKEMGLPEKGKKTRRRRRRSSQLTPREQEVYQLIHIEGKTQSQAAYELGCKPQSVSKLLKKAETKLGLGRSRSVSLSKAQKLPEDKRGQVDISTEDESVLDDDA
jgi:DNA-binding CsgD family transcriptional regulator